MAEQRLEEVAGVGLGRKGGCIHRRLSRRKQGCEEAKQRTGRPEVVVAEVGVANDGGERQRAGEAKQEWSSAGQEISGTWAPGGAHRRRREEAPC